VLSILVDHTVTGSIQSSGLSDPFGRKIDYVRLSVTDKCNLRCFYCLPKGFKEFEEPENWLTFNEIERVIRLFAKLGVSRVRLTGGEPLVRKNLPQLARRLANLPGLEDLSLSTNAVHLDKYASELATAGVSRVNVSLDSLKADRFSRITGGGKLDKVLDGLMAARDAGLKPVKINMVAMKGLNDDEFGDMLEFCIKHDFTLRFIETMPMGTPGEEASKYYLSLDKVREQLQQEYNLVPGYMPGGGPARYYQVNGTDLRIGFITPISQHFCETCNRVRLSTEGTLYLCLGQEHSVPLRDIMRQGISDDELEMVLRNAISLKPERHEFSEKPQQIVRLMSMTGG